jgi:hypothetical protein
MVEAVIRCLITIVVIALLFFLCVWVLGEIGIALPIMVVHCLYVLAALIIILVLYRMLIGPYWGTWWGPRV